MIRSRWEAAMYSDGLMSSNTWPDCGGRLVDHLNTPGWVAYRGGVATRRGLWTYTKLAVKRSPNRDTCTSISIHPARMAFLKALHFMIRNAHGCCQGQLCASAVKSQ